MSKKTTIFQCENIGISGTTDVHVRQNHDETYEARVGIALLGITQMDESGFNACNHDPFNEKFFDNYAYGVGETEEEAINAMKRNMRQTAESLWI